MKSTILFTCLLATAILALLFMSLRPVAEIPECYADMHLGVYPKIECPR